MNGQEILRITKCGDLFSNDSVLCKKEYRALAHQWHPDKCSDPDAAAVFAKISQLYQQAEKMLQEGIWEQTDYLLIPCRDGHRLGIHYQYQSPFELGHCYVTRSHVVYILDSEYSVYYENARKQISALHYGSEKMRKTFSVCVPHVHRACETTDGRYVLMLDKPEGVYPLRAVNTYFGGRIGGRHTAWIISRLSNIACFLQFNGLVHNGICMDNCFIDPRRHTIHLYGGWWYAIKAGERMLGTTADIFSVMSAADKGKKLSSAVTDLEAIKLVGRELLGDIPGSSLIKNGIPEPFARFLTEGSGSDAFREFEKWESRLADAYGKRKFITMTVEDLYTTIKGED